MFWVAIGVILFCLLLLISKVNIYITFSYKQDSQLIIVRIRFYGIQLLNKVIDLDEVENKDLWKNPFKGKSFIESLKYVDSLAHSVFETIGSLTIAARTFFERMHVHRLEWNTFFGTGDVSSTGIAAGGLWTIKGSLIGFAGTISTLECEPIISVLPNFQRKFIDSKFDCIVSIRIGQAMYALIKVIRKSSLKKEVYI
uniref:DUF2953 domain-containing protein n=1 Tax=Virgibacillus oceani TaxID=1479511 RepID=A0A917GYE0_9BACI|nr:hypothetical protein GCM10011398_01090 [Virgibacillus oceani]